MYRVEHRVITEWQCLDFLLSPGKCIGVWPLTRCEYKILHTKLTSYSSFPVDTIVFTSGQLLKRDQFNEEKVRTWSEESLIFARRRTASWTFLCRNKRVEPGQELKVSRLTQSHSVSLRRQSAESHLHWDISPIVTISHCQYLVYQLSSRVVPRTGEDYKPMNI